MVFERVLNLPDTTILTKSKEIERSEKLTESNIDLLRYFVLFNININW